MKKVLQYSMILALMALLCGCGSMRNGNQDVRQETAAQQPTPQPDSDSGSGTQSPLQNGGNYSYLTGLPVAQDKVNQRPLAVMLSNIKAGCPQSGLNSASVIYEAPVEGGITRLMGLFEDYENLGKIGSVRSSRDYFVYSALEFDAIYAHFGQATIYVGELLNSGRVDNISGAVAGIDRPAVNAFYRTSDRKAPHNLYLSGADTRKDIDKLGYSLTYHDTFKPKFTFAQEGEETDSSSGQDAVLLYPGGKKQNTPNCYSGVQAYFEYNREDGKYYRFEYGGKQVDELTGEQASVDNVIFQYMTGEVRDSNGYLAFGCHGDNGMKVQVFTRGKMTEGTWSRYSDNDPAIYVDQLGNPIELSRGKTWICLIWDKYGNDVVIE